MPNNCRVNWTVIASAAKQSRGHGTRPHRTFVRTPVSRRAMDCFVARALAMTLNGGVTFPKSTFLILGIALLQNRGPGSQQNPILDQGPKTSPTQLCLNRIPIA